MIQIRRSPDVATFLAEAGPFLAEREAEHNLILGLCSRLGAGTDPGVEPPYLSVAVDDDRIVAAALRTPPMNLILSESDASGTTEAFALDTHARYGSLPGILGPCEEASTFARRWSELTGARTRRVMQERIYRAERAELAPNVPGSTRPAGETDRDLLIAWLGAFVEEAFPEDIEKEPTEDIVRRRLDDEDGGLLFWEVEEAPVSLAGFGGTTPNGIRIGPVYTPPEHRRRGFAGALVGRMTRMLLDGGHRFCFLFTDLANRTSNGVYQRVGYEPVSDVDMYVFGEERVPTGPPARATGPRGSDTGPRLR